MGRMLVSLLALVAALLLVPSPGPSGEAGEGVVVLAVGDVQLGRGVGRLIELYGPDYPFDSVRDLVEAADLALFNLECALSDEGIAIAKPYSFKADPKAANGLARAGFDIAVLANNHSTDCGRWELPETLDALRSRGLTPVGAGITGAEAAAPAVVNRRGLRIAVLGRTLVLPAGVVYREDVPTVAVYDPAVIEDEIRAARARADLVIVSLHWGVEYARHPQESQRRIARELIDAGANLVIGHHTHTPQPVERYKTGLIAYSLGNFVFDSRGDGGRHGIILRCTLRPGGVQDWETLPVAIEECQPRPQS